MSDQDLDKLFRSKLEELQQAPTPGAWEKIQGEIDAKKSAFPWMRIAAAILVLITAGAIAWLSVGPGTDPEITASNPAGKDSTVTEESLPSSDNLAVVPKTEAVIPAQENNDKEQARQTAAGESMRKDPEPRTNDDERKPVAQQPKTAVDMKMTAKDQVAALTELPELPEQQEELKTETEAVMAKAETDGQTITFSIDEFSDAEVAIAQVADQGEKEEEEGLKKIWGLLRQVKEPETGLGELRDLKNNILAFGKDKRESD